MASEERTITQILEERGISLDVMADASHPDHLSQRQKLILALQEGEITKKRVEAFKEAFPFAMDAFKTVASHASEAQAEFAKTVKSSQTSAFDVVLKIVQEAESEEIRLEALGAAERMNHQNNDTNAKISNSNNETYKYISVAIVIGLGLIAGGTAAAKALSSR